MTRDERICFLAKGVMTANEVAQITGVSRQTVRRICRENGITPSPCGRPTPTPYGMSDASMPLRIRLGFILDDMVVQGKTHEEISMITGLTQREIGRAMRRPYSHDWKLSQIERTFKDAGETYDY